MRLKRLQTTESGIKYRLIKKGEGKKPQDGEMLVMNVMYKDAKDSVWMNTGEMGDAHRSAFL
ncbi:MAG: hypothetical protein HC842_06050 [Cytophagales bacterium]|nr:hypothetical protein [Cytophagales bacterium]